MLEFKGGLMGGELLTRRVQQLAGSRPRPAQRPVRRRGGSPLTGLVRGLGSLLSGLAIALGQIRESEGGPKRRRRSPAAEPEAAGARLPRPGARSAEAKPAEAEESQASRSFQTTEQKRKGG